MVVTLQVVTGDDWTTLRDRWESSHLVRAALDVAGLVLLAAATAS